MSKSSEFGKRVAKAMLLLSSSHVFFILQQAYKGKKWGRNGWRMTWEDAVDILEEVIKEKEGKG